MADTTAVTWIYPKNLQDGAWDDKPGNRRVTVRFTGTSDGTGETNITKVDLDLLKTHNGAVPQRTVIEWIQWNIFGITVALNWDRAPQAEIILLNENALNDSGFLKWPEGLLDPGLDDETGDILLTSTNADSGDNYDITMCIRLKD